MIHYDGVLFDLDGTLLDTAPDLGNALNHVLTLHDRAPCTPEQYRPVASDGAKGLLQVGFGERFVDIDYEEARQLLLDYYFDNICVDTQPFDGVVDYLQRLNQRKIPWGIVTNKPGWLTESLLTQIPIMSNCECVVSGDSYELNKPHPMPLLKAAESLDLMPERTLYVGDALRDIEAANSANMKSVAALYGYLKHPSEADSWQADFTIEHINELSILK